MENFKIEKADTWFKGDNLKIKTVEKKGKLLLLTLLPIIFIAFVPLAGAQVITVDPPYLEVNITINPTFTVNINISDVAEPGLYAWELKLYFNNTLLNPTQASYPSGHFLDVPSKFEIPPEINTEEGYILFGVTLLGEEPGRTGNGVLATVEFNGTDLGLATLELKDITLLDPEGNNISYTVTDGTVSIIPEFPQTLTLVILTVASLAIVTFRKFSASRKPKLY